ncbi:hypothetical protein CALCODRAFT_521971 [Calocera cornea HHB12733]|uniref:Uncharacterized protein n=1 Tax=Calocera cornea HHB12733 TaxID=1353952 RepID=A0A165C8U2_9BASI|nr:hypothetical protein CALCODRAFT_521971 [Calocera cornea HHB12733]
MARKNKPAAGTTETDVLDESTMLVARPQDLRKEQGSYTRALMRRAEAGELVQYDDISKLWGGLERLTLMAEDLGRTAVRPPWNFETLEKIADAELDGHMDQIDALHSSLFFYDDIVYHIKGRVESLPDLKTHISKDMTEDAKFVASIVGARIHYAYLCAASWYLLRHQLYELKELAITNSNVRNQVHQSRPARALYMQMFDLADRVVEMERYRFGQACAACPYFSKYFVRLKSGNVERIGFKKERAGDAFTSVVDFLIIQLALPGESPWSIQQLLAMLHEAFADNLKEQKKLSQQVNDALGDLSTTVQFLDMVDVPLNTPDAEKWKTQDPVLTPEFQAYLECQELSADVLSDAAVLLPFVSPLDKTKKQEVLDSLWKAVDLSCLKHTGQTLNLEQLWGLEAARQPSPKWTFIGVPSEKPSAEERAVQKLQTSLSGDYDPYERRIRALGNNASGTRTAAKKRLTLGPNEKGKAVAPEKEDDTDEYPPDLVASSEDDMPDMNSFSEESESDSDVFVDDELADPNVLERLLKEAIAEAETERASGSMFDEMLGLVSHDEDGLKAAQDYFAQEQKQKRSNPLKKLLDVLRGRNVPAKEAPSTAHRPSQPYMHAKKGPATDSGAPLDLDDDNDTIPALIPYYPPNKKTGTHVNTSEEGNVPDHDDEPSSPSNKKKPKKKARKGLPSPVISQQSEAMTARAQGSPAAKSAPSVASSSPSVGGSPSTLDVSRIPSLPVAERAAQSGHAYLRERGDEPSEKAKTRGLQNLEEARKKSRSWSPFNRKRQESTEAEEPQKPGVLAAVKNALRFNIRDDTADIMRRIMHAVETSTEEDDEDGSAVVLARARRVERMRPMKWKEFVKGMTGMGFSMDLTTAGSSVRFDPPNDSDRPITIHMPHPKAEYAPNQLRRIGWRLKKRYGWMTANFRPWEQGSRTDRA